MSQTYPTLFRAICRCTYPDPALRTGDVMVFFEADDYARATKKIVRLLAEIWGCRESFIGCWNLKDEHELILESDAETPRDWKLFETGAGPAPAYINVTEEGHPLFLVSPVNLQRLYRALAEVSHE